MPTTSQTEARILHALRHVALRHAPNLRHDVLVEMARAATVAVTARARPTDPPLRSEGPVSGPEPMATPPRDPLPILQGLAEGLTTGQLAARVGLTAGQVNRRVAGLRYTYGVRSRAAVVAAAVECGDLPVGVAGAESGPGRPSAAVSGAAGSPGASAPSAAVSAPFPGAAS